VSVRASADLVVLGAGPAGLGAAWRGACRGLSVVVVERATRVGGMAGSFEVAGVRVDHGSHRLHPATPAPLLADLRGLLGADLQTRPRNGRLRIAGRWVGFPLRGGELARALPKGLLARVAVDAATAPLRRPRADTYAEVLGAGLGPALYGALYAPYAAKIWGLPPERIAGEQARRRVTADSPWKIVARILRGQGAGGQGRTFYYPRRGYGQIVDALAEAAVAAGARIELGAAVEEIRLGAVPRVRAGGLEVEARHVFSTLPLPLLARLAQPQAPAPARAAADGLRFRAMTLLYLVHGGGRWTPYDAHYLPGPETPVTRVSEPANYRVSAEDPPGRTVLCAELPCAVGDPTWEAPPRELAALVSDGLARTGLPPVRLEGVEVRRLPHVYPVYEVGYDRILADLDGWAGELPALTSFGRLGLFAHDNTHHALAMAYDAVDALAPDARRDDDAWRAARVRFRDHVVED
jgi:protoporphyrinogen oxidase